MMTDLAENKLVHSRMLVDKGCQWAASDFQLADNAGSLGRYIVVRSSWVSLLVADKEKGKSGLARGIKNWTIF